MDGAKGDGGRDDPLLEQRVARLEEDVREIRADIREIRADVRELQVAIARIEGKLDIVIARTPTSLQLWGMLLSTWTAGAGIVFLMMRFMQP
jgi:uncharacterized coiled-coil protein SlyX